MDSVLFKERIASQIPAVKLLINSGYEYLTPNDCILERGDTDTVLLKTTLKKALLRINSFEHEGKRLPIPENLVDEAIKELTDWSNTNLRTDNKNLFYHLLNGKGLSFLFNGIKKSAHLHFFDFINIENNILQVTEEFSVQRNGRKQHYIPDIVILINGLPLAAIECKKPGLPDAVKKGIEQQLRNQNRTGITKFYLFQQILGSVAGSTGAKYGTIGTSEEFWAIWKESKYDSKESLLKKLVNQEIDSKVKDKIFEFRAYSDRRAMEVIWDSGSREVTIQDQCIHFVFRPDRLLDIIQNFIIFENDTKIAPRHQQYFAVKESLKRVQTIKEDGARDGGVIWHTTGSGKSYTMVMLAKSLADAVEFKSKNAKIIVVTDRVDLDEQITETFEKCGKAPVQAKSGEHLSELIQSRGYSVLTTIIDKFESVAKSHKVTDESENVFVLVDEGHRSQFGETHALMKNTFKKAAFIAFTGTPIRKVKKDEAVAKSTEVQFGEFIHKYTMENALEDGAVCPIVYEGRMGELNGNKDQLDRWFDRVTKDLNEEQKAALKKRFSMEEEILKADDRIRAIALDIKNHYRENFRQEGEPTKDFMKGQLATNTKGEALAYKRYLDEFGIRTSLVISPPEMREGSKSIEDDDRPEVVKFWDECMKRYGSAKKYQDTIIDNFKKDDVPEILIVVDKLLTGFDAPRNAVLYIDKKLKEHNVLQAIARVNRLYPRKSEGLVIDYRGIFDDMTQAIDFYRKMEGNDIDLEDIKDTLFDKSEEVKKLDPAIKSLNEHFSSISNMTDDEEIGRYLADENRRKDFYEKFRHFHNVYKLALGYAKWTYETPEQKKNEYARKYKFYANLRTVIKERYPDGINYEDYIADIRRLVDVNLKADPPKLIVERFDIFNKEKFEEETKAKSKGARADIIKGMASSHISERFDEDPIFYKNLSQVIEETYLKYIDRRISEADYLSMMEDVASRLTIDLDSDVPAEVSGQQTTKAYYRVVETIKNKIPKLEPDQITNLALKIDEIVKKHAVKDWHLGTDIEKKIIGSIEVEVFYYLEDNFAVRFSDEEMREVTDNVLLIAKRLDYR
ncbi:HsdR family type I site-specific deoxyribonuclease [Bdellovibrio bacteriovorus]|uniref:Type I restriction enzyme endonuclease subunit n=1 Tax=Bdellovibrio bacteriovorus (strain ATCC 15356 / DSM 50701 / NCIMB 9529 / HD100) TaxID=264462 RepID=Q6MH63_BDEBA|nr:HsdR family type I site-specific deoxyribonuclease [Bdellovibrio bacteriovorus]CAE81064.1 type I restriction-modification system restriction subunit [Bdellovibrio bacteriovorus HD100]